MDLITDTCINIATTTTVTLFAIDCVMPTAC
jgi:hypothetical protein